MILDVRETLVFRAFVGEVKSSLKSPPDREEMALALMSAVNSRLTLARQTSHGVEAPPSGSFVSNMEQLRHPMGACTSFTQVLAKVLMEAGYDVRKLGLEKNGVRAIHHVLEAQVGDRWVLMDPLYNQVFRQPDGHLASVVEVSKDWAWFKQQTPPGYNPDYDYSAYYYTNWDRVPFVGSFVRSHPDLRAWLRAHRVSVRFLFIDVFRCVALISGSLMLVVLYVRRRCGLRLRALQAAT